jgi:DNA replication protein DnaC
MTLPDGLAQWRTDFLAEAGLAMTDLINEDFEPAVQAVDDRLKVAAERIPVRYRDALATDPGIREWLAGVLRQSVKDRRAVTSVTTGPSVLLLGPTGTGKTFQAYGAVWGIAACGVRSRWLAISAADLYARMRPRHGVDGETEFRTAADATLLVLDDLGVAKGSEWVEEINYRLVNHRYENQLPTLFTSNIVPGRLAEALGERVASRLTEMTERVSLKGGDRRYGTEAA